MKKLILFLLFLPSIYLCQAQGNATATPPSFRGGQNALDEYIRTRLVYPHSAITDNVEGEVLVGFKLDEYSNTSDIRILQKLHPDCDSVALAIVKNMPPWTPGNIEPGFELKLPVVFKLPNKNIRRICDTMPQFRGGVDSLYQFIRQNLKYPLICSEMSIQGRVVIRFVVSKEGKIINPVILKSLYYHMDEEALRLIKIMPDWEPGIHNKEKVDCYYTIPIVFRLE